MTSRATIWRANQLCHTHRNRKSIFPRSVTNSNVPEGIRTPDPRLRRPLLYPAELRTHNTSVHTLIALTIDILPYSYTFVNNFIGIFIFFSLLTKTLFRILIRFFYRLPGLAKFHVTEKRGKPRDLLETQNLIPVHAQVLGNPGIGASQLMQLLDDVAH